MYGYDITFKLWASDMAVDLNKDGIGEKVSFERKKKRKKHKKNSSLSKMKVYFSLESLDITNAHD